MPKKKTFIPNSVIIKEPDITDSIYEQSFAGKIRKFKANQQSFDWRPFEPKLEKQGNTSDCTCFSRTNAAETVALKSKVTDDEGQEFNFADLYLAVGSNTSQSGNSLKAPSEFFRKNGVVLQKFCQYDQDMLNSPNSTWARRKTKFNQANTNPKAKKYKGGNYSFVTPSPAFLKDALTYSPLQIAIGIGYNYNEEGVIQPPTKVVGYHAVVLQFIDTLNQYFIYDHYDQKNKTLAANYPIYQALSFRDLVYTWRSLTSDDQVFYARLIGKLILRAEAKGELYEICPDYIEKVDFAISNKKVWQIIQQALRPNIIGISEVDFERLKKVAIETGKGIKEDIKMISYNEALKLLGKKK